MMRRSFLVFVTGICLCSGQAHPEGSGFERTVVEHKGLEDVFRQYGVDGAFILLDVENDRLHAVNRDRVADRRFPASTFKIANSLIALETGAVSNEDEVIPYGGKPQPIKVWERDMTLGEAMKVSNVAVFQEVARRVGLDGYQEWLSTLGYGNEQVGSDVERFWLRGPLAISPVEQAEFAARLASGTLPASKSSQSTVRDLLLVGRNGQDRLYAKTGWSISAKPQIGWWVGWVEKGDGSIYAFALTIDIVSRRDVDQRKPLGKALLKALRVYP
ncbi:class D beta-lactamase [Hoeflea prorocentri]|uniref:Beta-lactamase n=1 Tax=Hoeflea prorocentri TaxID=1922333 RepID=A0A9X3ZH95_9HYPH|nr:class D beta-lactamase [Hoeflea prorocentri]MCY6381074.1 class D beta-lactamase [Hoeflea prorocentri]MDA5398874.1 class D beta-lactamase [Hoeflea prorocentri]